MPGSSGAAETVFRDDVLHQTIDVAPLIRRGRTQAATSGFYYGIIRNIHGAANTIQTTVDPFTNTIGLIAPYPVPFPELFDLWVVSVGLDQPSGTGTLAADLSVRPPASSQGWGVTSAAAAIEIRPFHVIAVWDAVVTHSHTFALLEGGQAFVKVGMRLRPGTTLVLSTTSSAVATFDCQILLGVFPVSLGQDILPS